MKTSVKLPRIRIATERSRSGIGNLFSLEEFKALVKYERLRSDRSGSVFSVTTFSPSVKDAVFLEKAIQCISRLARSIDCIAMGEGGWIAVLLPDTERPGAGIFGEKAVAELHKIWSGRMEFTVYTYPENWLYSDEKADARRSDHPADLEAIKSGIEFLFVEAVPAWKRALDIAGSSIGLILAFPICLSLGIYIKLVSPGPVFFKQTRIGYKGVPFTFWKFRTMKPDNNQGFHGTYAQSFIKSGDVPMEKLDNRDPRIILGGKIIRKSCMDELPQLWNILKGDMSLVGPRPCIPYEAKEYLRWHTHRFDVLPGLSGLWQVSGKNKLTFKQMVRLDIAYCRNITFIGDMGIILRTPYAIIKMMLDAIVKKYRWRRTDAASVAAMPKGAAQ